MRTFKKTMIAGVVFTLLGGALWGVSGTSVQYLTTQAGAPPSLVTFLRVLVGGGLFFLVMAVAKRPSVTKMLSSLRTIGALLLFGAALYANQLTYAQTVQITNAGTATVLQMLGSVFIMMFVCARTKKLPRTRELIGLVLAVAATLLIATKGDVSTLSIPLDGLVWGIFCGLSTAAYILVPKQFRLFERFGSAPVVSAGMFLGSVFALPVYLVQGGSMEQMHSVLSAFGGFDWFVFLGGLVVVGTIGGYGFYLHGVSIVGPVRGSLLGAIEPVSAMVMAALWLGTAFTVWDVAGMVLMCMMVAFLTTGEQGSEQGT